MKFPAGAALAVATILFWAGCAPQPAGDGSFPQRIISTAPSITQMIYTLGVQERLVGVTSYCDYPPEALQKPRIGSFAAPSMEAVLAREPDLVVILADRQDLETQFRALGVPVLMIDIHNLDGVLTSLEALADRLGTPEAGRLAADRLRTQLEERRRQAQSRPQREVLVLVGRNPGSVTDLYAVGGESYLADLVAAAGGRSIFDDAAVLYPKVSIEEILVRDPEIILDLSQMGQEPTADDLRSVEGLWRDFQTLRAVRQGRVFVLDDDVLLVPGPRMIEAVDRLQALFEGSSDG